MREQHFLLAIALTCCMLLVGCGNGGEDAVVGYELTYEESTDGSLCITGLVGTATEVAIPSEIGGKPVTQIAAKAFANRRGLAKVSIPASVGYIGDAAFFGCVNVTLDVQVGSCAMDYAISRGMSFNPVITAEEGGCPYAGVWEMSGEEHLALYINNDGAALSYSTSYDGTFCIYEAYECREENGAAYLCEVSNGDQEGEISLSDGVLSIDNGYGSADSLTRIDNSDEYQPATLGAVSGCWIDSIDSVSYDYYLDDTGAGAIISGAAIFDNVESFVPRTIDGYTVVSVDSEAMKSLTRCEYVTFPEGIQLLQFDDIGASETVSHISLPDRISPFISYEIDEDTPVEFFVGESDRVYYATTSTGCITRKYNADGQLISHAGVWTLEGIGDGFDYKVSPDAAGCPMEMVLCESGVGAIFGGEGCGSPLSWRESYYGIDVTIGENTYTFADNGSALEGQFVAWADPAPSVTPLATFRRTCDVATPEALVERDWNFVDGTQDASEDTLGLDVSVSIKFCKDGMAESTVNMMGFTKTEVVGAWVMRGDKLYFLNADATSTLRHNDYALEADTFTVLGVTDLEPVNMALVIPYDFGNKSLTRAMAGTWCGSWADESSSHKRVYILREDGTGSYTFCDGLLNPQQIYESGTFSWKIDAEGLRFWTEDEASADVLSYRFDFVIDIDRFKDADGVSCIKLPHFEGLVKSAQKNSNMPVLELSREWTCDSPDYKSELALLPEGNANYYHDFVYSSNLYWTVSKSGAQVWAEPGSPFNADGNGDSVIFDFKYEDGRLVASDGKVFFPTPESDPFEQPATESASPGTEPSSEPTVEPTAEPTPEPTVEPTAEPTPEPTVEPTSEPTPEPTVEPVEDGTAGFEYEAGENGITITLYTGDDVDVNVPAQIEGAPVTAIGDNAFAGCAHVSDVILPDGIISIGNKAFFGCERLVRINMPASISSMGKFVFNNCPDAVLYVTAGSYADEYAQATGLKYEYMEAD